METKIMDRQTDKASYKLSIHYNFIIIKKSRKLSIHIKYFYIYVFCTLTNVHIICRIDAQKAIYLYVTKNIPSCLL